MKVKEPDNKPLSKGWIDWNKLPIEQMIKHLEVKFRFDSSGTAKAVITLIEQYKSLSAKITDIEKEYSDEWIEKNYDWIFRDNLKDMRDKIIERLKQ